jgi:hypothetical protein
MKFLVLLSFLFSGLVLGTAIPLSRAPLTNVQEPSLILAQRAFKVESRDVKLPSPDEICKIKLISLPRLWVLGYICLYLDGRNRTDCIWCCCVILWVRGL